MKDNQMVWVDNTMAGRRSSRPTYSEIAQIAGVSPATVSRVLNSDPRVDEDRVAAVHAAVDRLGYKRNRAAQALSSGRTSLIAVVIDDDLSVFTDPFWATVTSGISKVLMENEMQTILLVAPLNKPESPVATYLQNGEVDGAIFLQLQKDALIKKLQRQKLPLVVTGTPHTNSPFSFVDCDNAGGAFAAVRYLQTKGRKAIATITGDQTNTAAVQRLQGYTAAIERGIGGKEGKPIVGYGDWTRESGMVQMLYLLRKFPEVDAVFCANDAMALGAIDAIRESGKSVPDDIAIIGFDDSYLAKNSKPALTTVKQDIVRLGEEAARMILAKLRGSFVDSEILPCELVIRETA